METFALKGYLFIMIFYTDVDNFSSFMLLQQEDFDL